MPCPLARLSLIYLALWLPVELPAQASDEPSKALRELRQVAPHLSMDWVADGKLQSPDDMMAAAGRLLLTWPSDPKLRDAVLHYAAISPVYRTGLLLYRGQPAGIDDIPDLARAFVAGLTDDPEAKADTIASVLRTLVVTNAKIRVGSELIAAAVQEHASIWSSLADIVESGAGPAKASPLDVAVVVGDGRTTGLQFRNGGDETLHNVVLSVDSTLATADQGNVCTHTIFVPRWLPKGTVLLPPRLMLGAARGGGGDVTYRLCADEMRCDAVTVALANGGGRAVDAASGRPVVLRLGARKNRTAEPAAKVAAADDGALVQATDLLDGSSWQEAKDAFEQIESRLSKGGGAGDESRRATLAVARYRLAEVLRRMGFAEAKAAADDEDAKNLLLRAKRKYGEVLDAPDVGTEREGKSLHAAALRHVVQIEATLCQGYRLLAKQKPQEKNLRRKAEAHEAAAKRALKTLTDDFPDVRGNDGRTHLEAAKAAVREVMRAR